MRRVAVWVGWWLVLAALWMVLVDSTKLPELATCALAAAMGATAAALIREQQVVRLRFRARMLAGVPRAVARLPLDTAVVSMALIRRLRGRRVSGSFRAIRFRGARTAPEATAKRVLAKGFDSLGPNSYVVGIDSDERVLLAHQLVPEDDPASVDPMGLR